ncbi:MAG: aspartate dehydrogenase [Blautia sp.]|nr:aspartate dehydrogenase [Blautia marasmi]MDR3891020.1 aspartate dehydrogenase [Blautia sp.]
MIPYDRVAVKPVVRSICTGEQVAGFKDLKIGKFQDMYLIKSQAELRDFMEQYGYCTQATVPGGVFMLKA